MYSMSGVPRHMADEQNNFISDLDVTCIGTQPNEFPGVLKKPRPITKIQCLNKRGEHQMNK